MELTRRRLLLSSAAAMAGAMLPFGAVRRAQAATTADRKFLFLFNTGGWDPTRVLVDASGNPNVDVEADAVAATIGGLSFVDHPERPSVRAFLEQWHSRTVILNGLVGQTIAHDVASQVTLTGSTSGDVADWPARIAADRKDAYPLPYLVLSGPSYPADQVSLTARAGTTGQLQALINGDALSWSDTPANAPDAQAQSLMDQALASRTASLAASSKASALDIALDQSVQRALQIKLLKDQISLGLADTFEEQAAMAVEALSLGMSRSVMMSFPNGLFPYAVHQWDSHSSNDENQSPLWDGLFACLSALMDQLVAAPGTAGGTMADETVLVVLSEMGRTPNLNFSLGKDHWPHNSAFLVGPGLVGDLVVGGYDDQFEGEPIDLGSGEVASDGDVFSPDVLGATLLALADIDPGQISGGKPITGVLA